MPRHYWTDDDDAEPTAARPPKEHCIDYDTFIIVYLFWQLVGSLRKDDAVYTHFPSRHLWS